MAGTYYTPGVYVEEISKLPASVVPVATAIPAFVGYTEIVPPTVGTNNPYKVSSLVEYESLFGFGPTLTDFDVTLDENYAPREVSMTPTRILYDSLKLFYANGGGDCYIVTVGAYSVALSAATLVTGINSLELVDEPTLIVVPDAFNLSSGINTVYSAILTLCNTMQDRFGILDVQYTGTLATDATNFRTAVGTQYLKYGAGYYPPLNTTIGYAGTIAAANIDLFNSAGASTDFLTVAQAAGDSALESYAQIVNDISTLAALREDFDDIFIASFVGAVATTKATLITKMTAMNNMALGLLGLATSIQHPDILESVVALTETGGSLEGTVTTLRGYDLGYDGVDTLTGGPATTPLGVILSVNYPDYPGLPAVVANLLPYTAPTAVTTEADAVANAFAEFSLRMGELDAYLSALETLADGMLDEDSLITTSSVYAAIIQAIRAEGFVLPPSGAIAGVYASVDRDRGVWKAPANVSLAAVDSPVLKVTDAAQEGLNVHSSTGKSINAIRKFTGKGTLVWGARTLAGNDNEWRYISVRRFFNFVEESVEKATQHVVFEPNDANTWARVRAMIVNFLTGLWRDGALAGAKPDQAFYVNCGLGTTMTAEDILNGYLIIEIGLAAVRPAEFIVLRFSHMLQTS